MKLPTAPHTFLAGNGLPERWHGQKHFVILDTGFGDGLKFLATWDAWRKTPPAKRPRLHYLATENSPLSASDLANLLHDKPEFSDCAARLLAAWPTCTPGVHRLEFEDSQLVLSLYFGEAINLLPQLQARVDAFYLDNLAAEANPALVKRLGRLANLDATLTARNTGADLQNHLARAGFTTLIQPDHNAKPAVLVGRFSPQPWQTPPPVNRPPSRHALIIGAGLAGTACAERLAARGWAITLIDQHSGPAQAASGNPAGIVMPLVARDDNIASRLSRAAYLYALRTWKALDSSNAPARWAQSGVLQLARDVEHEHVQRALVAELNYPPEFIDYLNRDRAEAYMGRALPNGGWLFAHGGWANPPSVCRAMLVQAEQHARRFSESVRYVYGERIRRLQAHRDGWQALGDDGRILAAAPVVIIASGADAAQLTQTHALPIDRTRGQVSLLPEGALGQVKTALCREGYLTPAVDGWHCLGASYGIDHDPLPRASDHEGNLQRLERLSPGAGDRLGRESDPTTSLNARVGFRAVAPDRLPLVGRLPDYFTTPHAHATQLSALPRHPGLYAALGYASRGLVWSALMAELLASIIEKEPLPIETALVDAVDPGRFLLKQMKRSG